MSNLVYFGHLNQPPLTHMLAAHLYQQLAYYVDIALDFRAGLNKLSYSLQHKVETDFSALIAEWFKFRSQTKNHFSA